eukprot:gb/GEZN01001006.1/.p1 GENE.gb/GEZN01001006.1/~~gb/GEZN01001006.1/.p1  ORF type:complete len:956 (+),score=156.39 gb/GEZN01001006.1/:58-2925(+)
MLGLLFLLLPVWLPGVSGVDRKNFRTCAETPFCKRLRATEGGGEFVLQDYYLDVATLKVDEVSSSITADLLNGRHPKQKALKWSLVILMDGIIRVGVREENPKYPRWEVPDVLQARALLAMSPSLITWTKTQQTVTGKFGAYEIVVSMKPFNIVVSINKEKAMVINQHNLLAFEQYREKNPRPEDGSAIDDAKLLEFPYDTEGMWEHKWKTHTETIPRGPAAIALDVSFINSEHIFGVPEHASDFALKSTRGASGGYKEPFRLWNLDVFEYELDEPMSLYGAVPLLLSHDASKTLGCFWLNSAETYIDVWDSKDHPVQEDSGGGGYLSRFMEDKMKPLLGVGGKPVKNAHWISETGVIDAFFLLGPTPTKVFGQYASLTGFTDLPQHFATAYHQCRWNYKNEIDVAQVDVGFDEHDIPYDVLWLDIEHTDGKRYFTWDKIEFPTPVDMQNKLAAKGRKMVAIVDPHVKRDNNYHVHKYAEDNQLYIRNKEGASFDGWCWPGASSYLDFLTPSIRQYWAGLWEYSKYVGSTSNLFVWNDMNEPSVFNGPEITMPKDATHLAGTVEHRDVHNTYGFYHHMATAQGLIERNQEQERPFVLTRSFFAGSQRTASVWTGDNTAAWEHLDIATPMLLSLGISGIAFSGADVGGFFGDPDAELLLRWYQAGAFQPFFRAHAHIDSKRREPWLFGDDYTAMIRTAVRQRYAFLPYVYTIFHHCHVTGNPIMRPLWAEFPQEAAIFGEQSSFLLGDALLIKPITKAKQVSTKVYLPGGGNSKWYPLDSWKPLAGGVSHSVSAPLSYTPVFQRGGTIVPKQERARRNSALMEKDPYTLVVALDSSFLAQGSLYLDDGKSFQYRQGAYLLRRFRFAANTLASSAGSAADAGTAADGAVAPSGSFHTQCLFERVVVAGFDQDPKRVLLSSQGGAETELQFTKDSYGRVVVRKPDVLVSSDWKMQFVF